MDGTDDYAPSEYEPNNEPNNEPVTETKENNMNISKNNNVSNATAMASTSTPYGMLPTELAKQLCRAYTSKDALIAVMTAVPMDTNNIMVNIYKAFGVVINRASIVASLHKLKKSGEIRSAGRGLYVKGSK